MSFEIHPVREFVVSPALPPPLARLGELSMNLLWTWNHTIRAAFRRLDPALWRNCGYNPVAMLSRLPQAALDKAAGDRVYLSVYRKACGAFDDYMAQKPESLGGNAMQVAYFSMEYGLIESLTIYSGGLGILSGDHLKAATDAGLNLVGVGLLYQTGYFQQYLSPDGWQTERYPVNDFYTWPVEPARDAAGAEIRVEVQMPRGPVRIKVWRLKVGRVSLLPAGHERGGKCRDPGVSRHHGPAVRRRHARADAAGDRAGHRRPAGAEGAGAASDGVPHERGPFGVPGAGAEPAVDERTGNELRRGAGGDAHE